MIVIKHFHLNIQEDLRKNGVHAKAMRSVKDYACYAKTPEFRVIPMSVNTVINVIIPLR